MRITVPLLRDLVFLALGSAGMVWQLFLVAELDMTKVWICIGLLLGPAALNSVWRMRNPLPDPPTPTAVGPSSSPSSLQSPGS